MSLFWGFGLLLIGAWLGATLADIRWMLNSTLPDPVKCGSKTFKVVKPNNTHSWKMLEPYRVDPLNELDKD